MRGASPRRHQSRRFHALLILQVRLTFAEIYAALSRLEPSFAAARYDLLQHNCNAFCAAVARALLGRALPGFVDRPAAMARAVQAPIAAATWVGRLLREARAAAEARAAVAETRAATAPPAQNDAGVRAAVDGAANSREQGPHLALSWWADWLPSHAQRASLPAVGGGGGGSPDASEETPLPLDLHETGCELLTLPLDPSPHQSPRLNADLTLILGLRPCPRSRPRPHPHPLSPPTKAQPVT